MEVDRRGLTLGLALLLAGAALAIVGAGVGSTGIDSVFQARNDPVAWQILRDIRLPRTLGAWAAGAPLGLAGAVAQGLFRNPLADPYLLGSAIDGIHRMSGCSMPGPSGLSDCRGPS